MTRVVGNGRVHTGTKVSPFQANHGQNPRIGFELGKKEKYKGTERSAERMKNVQKEAKTVLQKAQENIKQYADRERGEVEEYRVDNLVLLSTKDLKY